LISVKNLLGYRVGAADGLTGGIVDFYFDDRDWSVRHIVTSEHRTRLHKAALMAPSAVTKIDAQEEVVQVSLTRAECEQLPAATTVVPVCRQYLMRNFSSAQMFSKADPHTRSAVAISGYEINDTEQHLGIVHDFLIDARTWKIAFVVGRRFGLQEREFLVAAPSVAQISFASRRVAIGKFSHWDLVFEERNGYDRLLHAEAA
jgi:hypothetical protein